MSFFGDIFHGIGNAFKKTVDFVNPIKNIKHFMSDPVNFLIHKPLEFASAPLQPILGFAEGTGNNPLSKAAKSVDGFISGTGDDPLSKLGRWGDKTIFGIDHTPIPENHHVGSTKSGLSGGGSMQGSPFPGGGSPSKEQSLGRPVAIEDDPVFSQQQNRTANSNGYLF